MQFFYVYYFLTSIFVYVTYVRWISQSVHYVYHMFRMHGPKVVFCPVYWESAKDITQNNCWRFPFLIISAFFLPNVWRFPILRVLLNTINVYLYYCLIWTKYGYQTFYMPKKELQVKKSLKQDETSGEAMA